MLSCSFLSRIDSEYDLFRVTAGSVNFSFYATVDPLTGLEEKECLPVNIEKCKKHTFLCCHVYLLLSFIFA